MKILADRLEGLIVSLFLLITLGLFWTPNAYFGTVTALSGESNPYSAASFAVLAGILAIGCVVRRDRILRLLYCAWPVFALVGLAFLSAYWSEAPYLTLRHAGTLAETTLFGIYLLARYDLGQLVALLVKVFVVAALASFAMMLIAPNLAIAHNINHLDSWRGAFTDKNDLGSVAAIAILISLFAFWSRNGGRWIAAISIAANILLLQLADSKTPLVGLVAALYVAILCASLRRRTGTGMALGYVLTTIGLAGAAFVAFHFAGAMALLNRSPTLTSRTQIWDLTIAFFGHKPWLGYGYVAFWRQDGVAAHQVQALLQWPVPTAHNAWIETGLAMGWLGIGLQAFVWLVASYRVGRALTLPAVHHVVLSAGILAMIFVIMLTESTFLSPGSIIWVLFTVVTVHLGHQTILYRAARRSETRDGTVARRPVIPVGGASADLAATSRHGRPISPQRAGAPFSASARAT
jgi:O-antigen ligase